MNVEPEQDPWEPRYFKQGRQARAIGIPLSDGPSVAVFGEHARDSWRAGWCDEDQARAEETQARADFVGGYLPPSR